jgi:hypothetical protein
MYEPLLEISPELILPSIASIPPNTVAILQTNRRFIESYMLGLNHEFSEELLWRRYPTDLRGTYFRQFWDRREYIGRNDPANPTQSEVENGELKEDVRKQLEDIQNLDLWGSRELEQNGPSSGVATDKMVLLIRGELLLQFPNALILVLQWSPSR